jgi:hypothetical protein
MITVGTLWLALGGLCTASLWLTDKTYGLWFYGLVVALIGVFPLWIGLSEPRRDK